MNDWAWLAVTLGASLALGVATWAVVWRRRQPAVRLTVAGQRALIVKGRSLLVSVHLEVVNSAGMPRLIDALVVETQTPGAGAQLLTPGWDDPDRVSLVRDPERGLRWSTPRDHVLRMPLALVGWARASGAVLVNVRMAVDRGPVGLTMRAVAQGKTVGVVSLLTVAALTSAAAAGDGAR